MFDFSQIEEVRLAKGNHASAADGMCFMEMTAWFAGEKHSDRPECACPILGSYGIRLNDAMPDDVRDRLLKPLVPLVAGTRDKASEIKRAEFMAIWAVTKILPVVLRLRGFDDLAVRCEGAADLSEARDAANAAANAADAAANAAACAANAKASYDADASRAYANAAAAANAAAYAAKAAYDAAACAAARRSYFYANAAVEAAAEAAAMVAPNGADIWEIAADGLRQAILIGRHDGFDVAETVLIERRAKLLELVA